MTVAVTDNHDRSKAGDTTALYGFGNTVENNEFFGQLKLVCV